MITLDPSLLAGLCIGCIVVGAAAVYLISRRYQPTGTTPQAIANLLTTVQQALGDKKITPEEASAILSDLVEVLRSLDPKT